MTDDDKKPPPDKPGEEPAPVAAPEQLARAPWPLPSEADDWPLVAGDADLVLPAPPPIPAPPPPPPSPAMPSPAAAAYEAARIVGEMVGDI
ncbi:MAG TPA: hypothetical protein VFP84_36520, partial [Kofleriaceae bacterium]|nr:hypothetical protein [Kofleriaceae bacterium]